ncbi:unnamed protein product, partial [Mesorhabditis belari]|uniref:Uncharacterized protein n=1 Tax=Mesorhabditis belari TaxID=2138241 RepID=A0AAF3EXU1_9BILA
MFVYNSQTPHMFLQIDDALQCRCARCVAFKLLKKAGYLNQYKIDAEYNIDRSYEKVITHSYRLLRSWNWWNWWSTDLEIVSNSNNRVSALVEIEPENRRYVNLTINTPEAKSNRS